MNKSEKLKLMIQKEKDKIKAIKEKEIRKAKEKELEIANKEIRVSRSKMTVQGWKDVFRKREKSRLVIINMELNNGHHNTFYVTEEGESFKHKGSRYIFDIKLKYYNVGFNEYCYDYHESFNLPIKREFPINDTKTAIESSGMIDSQYATNPSTLERFMNSSIIEMMLRGGAIDKLIKILLIIGAFGLIISVSHLILYMYQSGIFDNLGI